MLKYVLKRIGLMLITFSLIIFLVFIFIRLMPDFVKSVVGTDPNQTAWLTQQQGLNLPVLQQFGIWLKNILLKGNFGWSTTHSKDTIGVLLERIPITLKINIIPFFLSIPIGVGLGIWAALKKNKITDHAISVSVMIFIAVPSFVVATLLQYLFSYVWKILPPHVSSDADIVLNPILAITSIILPTLALMFGSVAGLARTTRSELTEVLTSDFMLLCRTKGLTRTQSTVRHALRNAMVPLAPSLIGGFVATLSGSMIIEKIFRISGVGNVYIEAFGDKNHSMVMVVIMFYTFVGLISTLIIDLSYGIIDPRIRMGEK